MAKIEYSASQNEKDYDLNSIRLNGVAIGKIERQKNMLSAYFSPKACINSLNRPEVGKSYPVVVSGRLISGRPFGGARKIIVILNTMAFYNWLTDYGTGGSFERAIPLIKVRQPSPKGDENEYIQEDRIGMAVGFILIFRGMAAGDGGGPLPTPACPPNPPQPTVTCPVIKGVFTAARDKSQHSLEIRLNAISMCM